MFARNRSHRGTGLAPSAREGAQLGLASAVRAHRRVLRCRETAELDGRVGSRRLGSQPVALVGLGLVNRDDEAALGEFLRGGEAGDAGPEDRHRGTRFAGRRRRYALGHGDPARSSDSSVGLRGRPDRGVDVGQQRVVGALDVIERTPDAHRARLHGLAKRHPGIEHVEDGDSGGGDPGTGHAPPHRRIPEVGRHRAAKRPRRRRRARPPSGRAPRAASDNCRAPRAPGARPSAATATKPVQP